MPSTTGTVRGRIAHARYTLSPLQLGVGIALITLLATTLLFFQEPLVHDALHNFRHTAGITCH